MYDRVEDCMTEWESVSLNWRVCMTEWESVGLNGRVYD